MPFSPDKVLEWVNAGYPDGVPDQDGAALVGLLRHRLGSAATLKVALQLVAGGALSAEHAVAGANGGALVEEDVRRVSAHLVLGGWPLASPVADGSDDDDPSSPLGRIVGWLREGYPTGVPDHDYVPLLALLERRLSKAEVKKVASQLRREASGVTSTDEIAAAISDVTHAEASEADLMRVRDRLAAKGWPVEFPDPGA